MRAERTSTSAGTETTRRVTVAGYDSYTEAQKAVDHLADGGFPVDGVAIVADGIRFTEVVTGRRTYPAAIAAGALNGAFSGAVLGMLIGLLAIPEPSQSAIAVAAWGVVLGALIGAVTGLITRAVSFRGESYDSIGKLEASRYEVMVRSELAGEARGRLRRAGVTTETS